MSRRRLEGDGARLALRLHDGEREVLRQLVHDVDLALDGPTDDAVVARLFPPVVEDDAAADTELRSLFASELLLTRHEALATVAALLDGAARDGRQWWLVDLGGDGTPALLLGVLNDLRLAIAARTGTDVISDPRFEDDDAVAAAAGTLEWLAGLQLLLLETM